MSDDQEKINRAIYCLIKTCDLMDEAHELLEETVSGNDFDLLSKMALERRLEQIIGTAEIMNFIVEEEGDNG